ncbi:MAG: hypothetical protein ACP5IE_06080 [Infirmifilum sp.]
MENEHLNPSRLVSKGRIKALFSEEGDILYLDIDGSIYEGIGDTVPVPIWRLRRLRLKDIPNEVFIEPVERIQENIVYTLRYSPTLFFDVKVSNSVVLIELNEWAQTWESYIGFYAYMEALSTTLEEAEEAGFVRDLYEEFSDDAYTVSFIIDIPGEMTVLKALKVVKRILAEIERVARYRAAVLAYREARKIIKRSRGYGSEDMFLMDLEKIYRIFDGQSPR